MSEYGQIINASFDPSKIFVYEAFYTYFCNPDMTKIKNVENFSVYMTKIYAMLGNAYRYLILFVNIDTNSVGAKKKMKDLEWVSLQTRTLEDSHNIPKHTYEVHKGPPLDQRINIIKTDEQKSIYEAEKFPLIITLLHTRKNSTFQYNKTGTIVSALETFQTIINFK